MEGGRERCERGGESERESRQTDRKKVRPKLIHLFRGPLTRDKKDMWGKLPLSSAQPSGMVLHIESMDGEETSAINYKRNGSLRDAAVTVF
jgi:hypothetical protein